MRRYHTQTRPAPHRNRPAFTDQREAVTNDDAFPAPTGSRISTWLIPRSAVRAPAAGFGDTEFYPDFVDKAAVLLVHLARNHPLPDGNKRVAWVAIRLFLEINDWSWTAQPAIDDTEGAVLAIASGEWDETRTASWLRPLLCATE